MSDAGAAGRRVLHVGYEPKHDSTAALLRGRVVLGLVAFEDAKDQRWTATAAADGG